MQRSVYRHSDLRRLVEPRRIAIVGASASAGSLGALTRINCAAFDGAVHLVNPKGGEIDGQVCYPSVTDLPEVPDCAVLAVPRTRVEAVVAECAAAGIGAAVIYAAGFAEVPEPEWPAAQARLSAIARESGLRLLGPNTAGLANHKARLALTFSPDYAFFHRGGPSVGIVSQSGGICNGMTQAGRRGISISHSLSTGNACDVDVADLVAYLAEEPSCSAIAFTFEGLEDPLRLLEAGGIAREHGKPVVVFKAARGAYGAAAAASHSGMLAGSSEAYDALFRRVGAVVVDGLESLMETAAFFAKAGPVRGVGLAVVASSGGAAIIAGDAAEAHGVSLPRPGDDTSKAIAEALPAFGAVRNPCDLTAQIAANEDMLRACADALFADPAYAAVAWPLLYARDSVTSRRHTLRELAAKHDKPAIVLWLSEWLEGPGLVAGNQDPRTAVFHSVDRAMAAVAAWLERDRVRRERHDGGRTSPAHAAEEARALLRSAGATVTESISKRIFAAYGIGVVEERTATTAETAAFAATAIGFPVVLKVESPDLPHKSEAGAVRLGLRTRDEVARAFDEVIANARAHAPAADIHGVVVQRMMPPAVEVMVGGRVDPLFGPLLVVAIGGVFVEVLSDSVTALAPVSAEEAKRLLSRLRGRKMLDGVRGGPAVDQDALARTIACFSEFLADAADLIEEADVNPLLCRGSEIVAVDGLIVPARQGRRRHAESVESRPVESAAQG